MQGDYTRKTQEVAPWRKIAEEFELSPDQAREALALVQNLQNPDVQRQLYDALAEQFANGEVEDDDPEFNDPRDAALTDLQARLERFEQQQLQAEVERELAQAEAAIRAENPSWSDEDMQTVAQFAIAYNGDMMKGAEAYKNLQTRIVKSHLDGKASVPAGTGAPSVSGNAERPAEPFSDLEEAHKAALAYWNATQA